MPTRPLWCLPTEWSCQQNKDGVPLTRSLNDTPQAIGQDSGSCGWQMAARNEFRCQARREPCRSMIGTSMGLETCLVLGQVSHISLHWKKNLLIDMYDPGKRLTRKQQHSDQIISDLKSGKQ